MANDWQLEKLKRGYAAWNAWRALSPETAIDLSDANLSEMFLGRANLSGVNLAKANLVRVNLVRANLTVANIREANLARANFVRANLSGADFSHSILYETVFGSTDLTGTRGLATCQHLGPSIIDHSTILKSSPLPESFLRGCGLSEWQIEASKLYQPDLSEADITDIVMRIRALRTSSPVQISNLFLSYSLADAPFVEQLERVFQNRGIRYWCDVQDAPEASLDQIILRATKQNATVLLLLSERSVESDWIEFEAQKARELENELGRRILFPIGLDNAWKGHNWSGPFVRQIETSGVLDFSDWKDAAAFETVCGKLIEHLAIWPNRSPPGRV